MPILSIPDWIGFSIVLAALATAVLTARRSAAADERRAVELALAEEDRARVQLHRETMERMVQALDAHRRSMDDLAAEMRRQELRRQRD